MSKHRTGNKPKRYSNTFKMRLVKRLVSGKVSATALSKETGVSPDSLWRWRQEFAPAEAEPPEAEAEPAEAELAEAELAEAEPADAWRHKPRKRWTREQKLRAVRRLIRGESARDVATSLRVPESYLSKWQRDFGNKVRADGASKLASKPPRVKAPAAPAASDSARVRELEAELARKDRALADIAVQIMAGKMGMS